MKHRKRIKKLMFNNKIFFFMLLYANPITLQKGADAFKYMYTGSNLESKVDNIKDDLRYIYRNYVPYFNNHNYDIFKNSLIESGYDFPNDLIEGSDMIPQGVTVIDKYLLISAYDKKGKNNSIIYIIDLVTKREFYKELDNKAHVGGITYDKVYDNVWISGEGGHIDCYSKYSIIDDIDYTITPIESFKIGSNLINYENLLSASTLCYDDNKLYVGSFQAFGKEGLVNVYNVKEDGKSLSFNRTFKIPNYVQGISFFERNNSKYLVLSRSFGTINDSELCVYNFDEEIDDYQKIESARYTMPSMMEQVTIKNDELISIYESDAKAYENAVTKEVDICFSNIDSFIKQKTIRKTP